LLTTQITLNLNILKYLKKNHDVIFYSGERQALDALELKYIKTFFHQERDFLRSIIKNDCLNSISKEN
jgi:hypothetical protein